MAQTHIGAMKTSAKLAGVSVGEYLHRLACGEKRCRVCKNWKRHVEFNIDCSRHDGIASLCRECQGALGKSRYIPADVRGRKPMGPPPLPRRSGDKLQARARINVLVRTGKIPNPNDVPCEKCGHCGSDRRHEYHHKNGYGSENHLVVEVLCSLCHHHTDGVATLTHCKRSHEFTPQNTKHKPNGNRICLTCRRIRDSGRRNAEYWRNYRAKKKEQNG